MKRFLLSLVILSFTLSSFSQDVSKLEELMDTYTKQEKFNGTVLVAYKGKVLLEKGYGLRSVADSSKNDNNSIFQIGSITKQFTSTVILKLQEKKKLNIEDKLSKYFPDYPKGDSITIQQLLTHTSGIYSYTSDRDFMENEVTKPSNRQKMMALFKDKPLDFSPGTQWNYSNSGYSLLGYIIEDVAKMPYEQAVRQYIFNNAGMWHSGFDFTHLMSKNKAVGYFKLKKDENIPAPIVDSSVSYSAGAIYSTAGDLYKWFQAMQQNKIISKESKTLGQTAVKNNYGFGWFIDSTAGKRSVGHSGGIHGFTSNMVSIPEDDACVILLSNSGSTFLEPMTKSIYAILYDKPYELPREKVAIELTEEELKQYVGTYDLNPELIVNIRVENGKLIGQPEGQGPLELHPEKKDQFFLIEVEAQVKFNRNEKNEVISMTLLQNGRELTGKKR
jgi:CubicO group peptidase (beta-lactamase class C family)